MKTIYEIFHHEHDDEYIEDNRLFKVFVFGLPRSGTSLMTHICELLGVNMIHSSESKKESNDKRYKEMFGEYHPNENGFFEISELPLKHYLDVISEPYSGCKMIIPVTDTRWELVNLVPCKIIMMERNAKEIKESQEAFYSQKSDLAYIRSALINEKLKLKESGLPYLVINYNNLIEYPEENISKIKEFIRSSEDIEEAVKFVNPQNYRHRYAGTI